jgi:hypothetical protein
MIITNKAILYATLFSRLIYTELSEASSLNHLSSNLSTDPECYKEKLNGKVTEITELKSLEKKGMGSFWIKTNRGKNLNINIDLTDDNGKITKIDKINHLRSLLTKGRSVNLSAYWCAKSLTLDAIE